MVKELEGLRPDERQVVLMAPVYVAVLIAGADGQIDKAEKKEAIAIARNRQSRSREQLHDFYNAIDFDVEFARVMDEMPSVTKERNLSLIRELRKLNFILPKVDQRFATKLYASLKDLSKKIAEASGGVLGYLAVGYEEAKLMQLKMLKDPADYK